MIEKAFRPLRTKTKTGIVVRPPQMTSAVYNSIVEAWNIPIDDLSHSLVRGALRKFNRSLAKNAAKRREDSVPLPANRPRSILFANEVYASPDIQSIIDKARANKDKYKHTPAITELYARLNTATTAKNIKEIVKIAAEIAAEKHKSDTNSSCVIA